MMKHSKNTATIMLVGMLLTLGVCGCQDREFRLKIERVVPFGDIQCGLSSTEGEFSTSGSVDLSVRDIYKINFEVKNNLGDAVRAKGLPETERFNTTSIVLESAVIEFQPLETITANIPPKATIPLSGTVNSSSSSLLKGFTLLDSDILDEFRRAREFLDPDTGEPIRTAFDISAHIRIRGETDDGRSVESNEFVYPVRICNGCLIDYPSTMLVESDGVPTCPAMPPAGVEEEDISAEDIPNPECAGTQGISIDCRQCQGMAVNSFYRQLCQPPRSP